MDAPQDRDVQLQRASSELLEELKAKLPQLLWKSVGHPRRPHRWARAIKTEKLIELVRKMPCYIPSG